MANLYSVLVVEDKNNISVKSVLTLTHVVGTQVKLLLKNTILGAVERPTYS